MDNKARVFVSCGQKRDDDNEIQIAHQISRKLAKMGFDPYLALEEQTLKGIKENIFSKLEESEYFVFIDFKREKMETGEHRGSLFAHQELAIAAFLDKDVLIFQEVGIKKQDGIISAIQGNALQFTDRHLLSNAIDDRIRKLNWKSNWRNELLIDVEKTEDTDAILGETGEIYRWYLLNVKNLHHRKNAFECIAYLESVKNVATTQKQLYPPIELKWNVVTVPTVIIPPRYMRAFGAFYVPHKAPSNIYFNINTFIVDNNSVINKFTLKGPGIFELTFVIFSLNFSPVRVTCMLEIGSTLNDLNFHKIKQETMGKQEQ